MPQKYRPQILAGAAFAVWHILLAYILTKLLSQKGGDVSLLVGLNILASVVFWLCSFAVTRICRKRNQSKLLDALLVPSLCVWLLVMGLLDVLRFYLQEVRTTDLLNPLLHGTQVVNFFLCYAVNKKTGSE